MEVLLLLAAIAVNAILLSIITFSSSNVLAQSVLAGALAGALSYAIVSFLNVPNGIVYVSIAISLAMWQIALSHLH